MKVLDIARQYLGGGVSLIPVALDGSKRPDGRLLPREQDPDTGRYRATWNPYRERTATEGEALRWWGGAEPAGLAAVCGAVSGGLELIDFDSDAEATLRDWLALVAEECPRLPGRLTVVRTPREPSGRHVWFRCSEIDTPGNARLARDGQTTLIETRGEGGYALVPGCPPACHPSGRPYARESGPPVYEAVDVSADERDVMWRCARLFDRSPAAQEPLPWHAAGGGELLPGSDYDLRGPSWESILGPHGWMITGRRGDELRWRRPGKDVPGWSATTGRCTGKDGADLLRVFSSNARPFEDGKAYGKFRALALLEHGGDLGACARELARGGFGSPLARARRSLRPEEVRQVLAVCRERPREVVSALAADPVAVAMLRSALGVR